MTLRFVALDLGNVLCDLDRDAFPTRLAAATGLTPDHIRRAFDEAHWHGLEIGDCDAHDFRTGLLGRLGCAVADDEFDRCWNLIPIPRPGADALVARLKVPHAIWSNTDPIHAAWLAPQMHS